MSTVVRTDEVPAADLVDFMRDLMEKTWLPMDCAPDAEDGWDGEFHASCVGPMQVVAFDIPAATVIRTPRLIAKADPDLMKLVIVRGGDECIVGQEDRQARLAPGDFAFYDTRRPYQVACGTGAQRRSQATTFMFPPSALPLSRSRLRQLTAVRFPAAAGLGAVTSQFLEQLGRNADHYSPAEAARLSAAALEVLATRLAQHLDADNWESPESRRQALLTTVQSFIGRHLGDTDLSPAMIAAAHHMSLRSLQQLFAGQGLTVAGWIRSRRLELCRRDLADPSLGTRPVAAIAARWGFASPGDFSRSFRAMHGLPPAAYRRHARDVKLAAR